MVTLRPLPGKRRVCPFVSDAGCRVYPDRPASCRIYPLARAIARNRQTGQTHEQFARLQESHCRGHANKKTWTAGQWMANQQLEEYNRINDRMMTLIRLKNQQHSGPLRPAAARMFFMACYDLDTFREQVLNHGLNDGLMDGQALSPRVQEQIASDDLFLIEFGMDWIKSILATS